VDFSSLCVSQAGGMAASEGTARHWQEVTGCPMVEGWGMSETCAIGTNNPVTTREFTGTIGLPLPGIDIAIKDDDGNSLPQGESGRNLHPRPKCDGGLLQPARRERQGVHAGRIHAHGGYRRHGRTRLHKIVDRKKDMILVSGFNVFPNELEQVISLCPGVVECAAVGIPDEKSGRGDQGVCREGRSNADRKMTWRGTVGRT
jgi:long-chain acyl-CoA synthetase